MVSFRKWKQLAKKITTLDRRQIIDYGSYAVAIIGTIIAGYQTFQGYLTPEQLAATSVIMTTLSQVGSMINKAVEKLEELP